MTVTITTNNRPRPVLDGTELTAKERKEFDYLGTDDDIKQHCSFVRYRGWVYDIAEFMVFNTKDGSRDGWDGHNGGDSFFSAVYMKYLRNDSGDIDPEQVVMATATW